MLSRPLERASSQTGTAPLHGLAVERVLATMRERLDEDLTLHDMADVAHLSPYHFTRVFRHVTGIPPCEFLTALRLQEAKRLLLTTGLSVTDVCFEVGYSSLGTFTAPVGRWLKGDRFHVDLSGSSGAEGIDARP